MNDYTLKSHTIDGVSAVSFPYYGMYITDLKIDHGTVIYPSHTRCKSGKQILDANGNPIRDEFYHPVSGQFTGVFEEWITDVVRTGRCSTLGLDTPDVYAYVTPKNFKGSDLRAFVCLNYHGLIIDDFALKEGEGGTLFLTMPHRSIAGPDGTRHPVNMVEIMSQDEYNRIMDLILEKYQIA